MEVKWIYQKNITWYLDGEEDGRCIIATIKYDKFSVEKYGDGYPITKTSFIIECKDAWVAVDCIIKIRNCVAFAGKLATNNCLENGKTIVNVEFEHDFNHIAYWKDFFPDCFLIIDYDEDWTKESLELMFEIQ